ncbi:coiled-coil domain-containing protein 112 [Pholidichthys leucotaenia]
MATLATECHDDKHYSQEEGDLGVRQPCCTSSPPASSGSVAGREDRRNAAQFIREAERNARRIEKLEKENTLRAQCRKNGWIDVCGELEEYERALESQRNAEKLNLQKQLAKIHNGVRKFQRHLFDVKPTPELIERLKEIMSEVEMSMSSLKEDQCSRFEEFFKEEKACRQEVTVYEKKIENWSLIVTSNPKLPSAPTVKTKQQDRDLPAEVRALEAFLQKTGGCYGGWDQHDHQAFLKVWTKHSGRAAYRKEAKLYLPVKTLEDIEQHEDWYQELIYLQDRKRKAIQRWKSSKQQKRQIRIQMETDKAERREKEVRSCFQLHRTEKERREMARQLEEWKEEKKRKEEEEEEQRLAEDIQKRRREKEERRRQLEVKLTLEEHLRVRKEEEELAVRRRREKEQREMEERRREAAKGIKRFNERDRHRVEAKLHEKQLKEREEEERQKKIAAKLKEKVDGRVRRDHSRLTQPTKGWQERMKHIGPSGGGPVLKMFHRAVPTWRQGL